MRKRITRAMLVTIGVAVLVLSLGIAAAAAGNGNGSRGETGLADGSCQQNGWQQRATNGEGQQSCNANGTCQENLYQNRWQQNQANQAQGKRARSGDCTPSDPAAEITALNEEEIHWLTYMREEEKLARDIYTVLYDQWDVAIFNNIAQSEQRHMDAIEKLIEKYGISDPVADETVSGNFTISELNTLYDSLKTQGLSSLQEAYQVGVDIEALDIEDLEAAIAASGEHLDIVRVYSNLLEGSSHHLAAFNSYLD
jgi:hypothetical protein